MRVCRRQTPVQCRMNGHKKSHELTSVDAHVMLSSKSYFYIVKNHFEIKIHFSFRSIQEQFAQFSFEGFKEMFVIHFSEILIIRKIYFYL